MFETNRAAVHNLVHELGHSFSLPHTFLDGAAPEYGGVHYFYKGYTDNIMDYGGRLTTPSFVAPSPSSTSSSSVSLYNTYTMNATFKWQWNLLRNDGTLTSSTD